jgi:hypothetical protein
MKVCNRFVLIYGLLLPLFGHMTLNCVAKRVIDERVSQAYETIRNPAISDDELADALLAIRKERCLPPTERWLNGAVEIVHLGGKDRSSVRWKPHEPPEFWIEIVNSSKYSDNHRTRCLFEFFLRYVPIGTKVSELMRFNGVADWFKSWVHSTRCDSVRALEPAPGECVVALAAPFLGRTWRGLLLSIEGEPKEVMAGLTGSGTLQKDLVIRQIVFVRSILLPDKE